VVAPQLFDIIWLLHWNIIGNTVVTLTWWLHSTWLLHWRDGCMDVGIRRTSISLAWKVSIGRAIPLTWLLHWTRLFGLIPLTRLLCWHSHSIGTWLFACTIVASTVDTLCSCFIVTWWFCCEYLHQLVYILSLHPLCWHSHSIGTWLFACTIVASTFVTLCSCFIVT